MGHDLPTLMRQVTERGIMPESEELIELRLTRGQLGRLRDMIARDRAYMDSLCIPKVAPGYRENLLISMELRLALFRHKRSLVQQYREQSDAWLQ